MDVWSTKKRVVLLIVIGVVLIALIAVPIIIIQLNKLPDVEDFLRVNTLNNVISEHDCVMITYGDTLTYFEKTDRYFNYVYGTSSNEILPMNYAVNGKSFTERDGEFYYNYLFDEKIQEPDSTLDNFAGFEMAVNTASDDCVIKKKNGKYFMTFEMKNWFDSNKSVYEIYFNKNLYLYNIKQIDAGKTYEQKFTYGKKFDYPEYIKNYDSGDRVAVKVINLLANKTEEFELKKGSLFSVIYIKAGKPFSLFLDEACTIVYSDNNKSPEPVNEDITIYMGEKITK